jgi:ABC-2 type transport system permease protein
MAAQLAVLISSHLSDRRRSLLAWGLPLGLMSAFIVAIFPSVEDSIGKAVSDYPPALREAFGIGELSDVEEYLHAEMLSLIVPLALGYLAVRAVASGLAGAAESGRLDVLLSAALAISYLLTMLGSVLAGAGLAAGPAAAGFASVWPLALLFAGLGIVVCAWSLRTSVVTGAVAGVLVGMYVADLIGRLDPSFDWLRYASVFKYYGNAIEDGIEPIAFCGVAVAACALAALGAWLFDRRDLSS